MLLKIYWTLSTPFKALEVKLMFYKKQVTRFLHASLTIWEFMHELDCESDRLGYLS